MYACFFPCGGLSQQRAKSQRPVYLLNPEGRLSEPRSGSGWRAGILSLKAVGETVELSGSQPKPASASPGVPVQCKHLYCRRSRTLPAFHKSSSR
jgi:hypothetical protein